MALSILPETSPIPSLDAQATENTQDLSQNFPPLKSMSAVQRGVIPSLPILPQGASITLLTEASTTYTPELSAYASEDSYSTRSSFSDAPTAENLCAGSWPFPALTSMSAVHDSNPWPSHYALNPPLAFDSSLPPLPPVSRGGNYASDPLSENSSLYFHGPYLWPPTMQSSTALPMRVNLSPPVAKATPRAHPFQRLSIQPTPEIHAQHPQTEPSLELPELSVLSPNLQNSTPFPFSISLMSPMSPPAAKMAGPAHHAQTQLIQYVHEDIEEHPQIEDVGAEEYFERLKKQGAPIPSKSQQAPFELLKQTSEALIAQCAQTFDAAQKLQDQATLLLEEAQDLQYIHTPTAEQSARLKEILQLLDLKVQGLLQIYGQKNIEADGLKAKIIALSQPHPPAQKFAPVYQPPGLHHIGAAYGVLQCIAGPSASPKTITEPPAASPAKKKPSALLKLFSSCCSAPSESPRQDLNGHPQPTHTVPQGPTSVGQGSSH